MGKIIATCGHEISWEWSSSALGDVATAEWHGSR
jgi:hypothetical protein